MLPRAVPRTLLATLAGLLLSLTQDPAVPNASAAERPRVSIGDVSIALDASSGDGTSELGRALRLALSDELAQVSGLQLLKQPLIVSATLTRLSSAQREERTTASATISLALQRANDRVLFAELRGRASVEEASGNLASLRHAALRGAVHGAVARLPEAVARAR